MISYLSYFDLKPLFVWLDDITEWSCSDVKRFLISNKFDEDLANDLERNEIDGIVLKTIADEENLKGVHDLLGISLGKLLNLRFYNQTFLVDVISFKLSFHSIKWA